MGLEFVDVLTLPGNPAKPNEDSFAHIENAAAVFDGATGLGEQLMPGESDAAWLAHFGARRLMAHIRNKRPNDALRAALADAENSFKGLRRRAPAATYENPFASMMFVAISDGGFDALWFGDCGLLVKRADSSVEVIGDTFDKRAMEAARVKMLADARGLAPAAGVNRPEYLQSLRKARNRVNTDAGGWLFGPDSRAADHARHAAIAAPQGTYLLLASDGFLALASDYGRYNADELMQAALSKGLAALGEELRMIEDADPEGRKYARLKKSDDATALLLKTI
jgi:Protein phosphatase 2C